MIKQTDYPNLYLGQSGLSVRGWGCVAMDCVQSLNAAGWEVTPEEFIKRMNDMGGFTRDGLLIWAVAEKAYPQFHYLGTQPVDRPDDQYAVNFVQGVWGRFLHWIAQSGDNVYDPYYGVSAIPSGFRKTGQVRYISIEKAPAKPEYPKQVTVTYPGNVYVRTEPTSQSAPVDQPTPSKKLTKGDTFTAVDCVDGEDPYGDGNNKWYKSSLGNYVYTGACN